MFVLQLAIYICYWLNGFHIMVAPPVNDKINTMINDYFLQLKLITKVHRHLIGLNICYMFAMFLKGEWEGGGGLH
jgi:hypothetical protein